MKNYDDWRVENTFGVRYFLKYSTRSTLVDFLYSLIATHDPDKEYISGRTKEVERTLTAQWLKRDLNIIHTRYSGDSKLRELASNVVEYFEDLANESN